MSIKFTKRLSGLVLSTLLLLVMLFSFNSATAFAAGKVTIEVAGPPAPPTFPLLRMMDGKTMGEDVEIKFNKWTNIETLMGFAKDEKISFIGVPLNTAVNMYNKKLDIKLMNINTWSVMGVVTKDKNVNSWKDLKGKTIYIVLKSSPVDYITQTFLKENGVNPGTDIEIVYTQLPEAAQLFISGKADTIVSIEPQKTMVLNKVKDAREVLDYKAEWQKLSGLNTDLPNAGLLGKGKFIENNAELAQKFQEKYKEALEWVLANPAEAGKLAKKYLDLDAKTVEQAIPNMALDFKAAKDSKKELEKYYNILFEYNKDSIGGKLPDEKFYYNK